MFINFIANPGKSGNPDDISDYDWAGDFTGTVDVNGGLVPKSMSTFGEVSVTASMDWAYNKSFGLLIGQIDVEVSGKFVIGSPHSEVVRLEFDARFKAPCKASDVIEANATLFVHAAGNPDPLLSIPGAGPYTSPLKPLLKFIPCNHLRHPS